MIEDIDRIVNPDIYEKARKAADFFTEEELTLMLAMLADDDPNLPPWNHDENLVRRPLVDKLHTLLLAYHR